MNNKKICIIGLGYVGLPLAHAFSFEYDVIGFDLSKCRIDELELCIDRTLELDCDQLNEAKSNGLKFTSDPDEINDSDIYIVTVPTPIDKNKNPDLTALFSATKRVGKSLSRGNIVIYESTVYPGTTEDECVPILERESNLIFNKDFFCGYSPERINPGDKEHTVTNILKVTSGSTESIACEVDNLYKSIIKAGTYLAPSIKVAEAAKVIENAQRDINIAFVNELAIIFNKLNINTNDVLEAAGTKWNFLPFKPGLVGGHCIGVDPYYLTFKAQSLGYNPEIILAGRRLNDNMGIYIANQLVKLMIKNGSTIQGAKVLILGVTFKENCPDIRNSKVFDIVLELEEFGCSIDAYDPWANKEEVMEEYGVRLIEDIDVEKYSSILVAVAHEQFKKINLKTQNNIVYDIKSITDVNDATL